MNTLGTLAIAGVGYIVLMLFVIGLMRAAGLRRPRRDEERTS